MNRPIVSLSQRFIRSYKSWPKLDRKWLQTRNRWNSTKLANVEKLMEYRVKCDRNMKRSKKLMEYRKRWPKCWNVENGDRKLEHVDKVTETLKCRKQWPKTSKCRKWPKPRNFEKLDRNLERSEKVTETSKGRKGNRNLKKGDERRRNWPKRWHRPADGDIGRVMASACWAFLSRSLQIKESPPRGRRTSRFYVISSPVQIRSYTVRVHPVNIITNILC